MGIVRGLQALGGVGESVRGVARVFRADASEGQALRHGAHRAALGQMGAEFAHAPDSWFDRLIDGLNRLPRPLLAFGTIGLFVFSMVDPVRFAGRMEGLAYVPEPLWWLLGAIVGFYFGARELHHRRERRPMPTPEPFNASWHHSDGPPAGASGAQAVSTVNVNIGDEEAGGPEGEDEDDAAFGDNAALAAWRAGRG